MADNQSKPNYPPSDSSEDEEEEVSGSEEEEEEESSGSEVSDSDSEPKKPEQNKPELTKIVIKPREPEQKKPESTKISIKPRASSPSQLRVQAPGLSESESESEEEESGSDSDSDSPPKKPVSSDPKPISSKPMESVVSVSEQVKKTVPPVNAKRQAATGQASDKDVKKPKTSNTVAEDDSKKQLFQRLWSEDDEIVILKGMIDYKTAKNGESPSGDMGAFHEFIKKSLHVDVSRAQLVDKVRRLKKKFVNNVGREKNGKDRMFSKSHEQKGYELSKLIWGSGSGISGNESKKNSNGSNNKGASTSTGVVKSNGLDYKEDSMMDVEKSTDISRFVQYGRSEGPVLTEEIMKGGIESLEGRERVEMEEKWKELKKLELELFVKRMDLLKEQAVRVLEVVNSSR